jgi:hypothetical protein
MNKSHHFVLIFDREKRKGHKDKKTLFTKGENTSLYILWKKNTSIFLLFFRR